MKKKTTKNRRRTKLIKTGQIVNNAIHIFIMVVDSLKFQIIKFYSSSTSFTWGFGHLSTYQLRLYWKKKNWGGSRFKPKWKVEQTKLILFLCGFKLMAMVRLQFIYSSFGGCGFPFWFLNKKFMQNCFRGCSFLTLHRLLGFNLGFRNCFKILYGVSILLWFFMVYLTFVKKVSGFNFGFEVCKKVLFFCNFYSYSFCWFIQKIFSADLIHFVYWFFQNLSIFAIFEIISFGEEYEEGREGVELEKHFVTLQFLGLVRRHFGRSTAKRIRLPFACHNSKHLFKILKFA